MSGRSMNSSNIIVTTGVGGSVRQHTSSGLPNGVKFAGEDSKDKMYEPKHTKKLVRVLTVVAYIFSVSLAAIMLSVYYVFLWNPKDIPHRAVHLTTPTPGATCPHPPNASVGKQEKPPGKQTHLIMESAEACSKRRMKFFCVSE
ncbi:hypothetical protein C0J52_23802 [Blattella germanica]|nr:hypothetical protein C0J52_23802 [Blattella germanica]